MKLNLGTYIGYHDLTHGFRALQHDANTTYRVGGFGSLLNALRTGVLVPLSLSLFAYSGRPT